ncbi:MAG TPA: hypothetical protein VFB23_03725 [Candidatus Acidoferrales bacterium]|jgi:hypothetical protein|nr:hypothetical protein [Candidatus Acidoferrales bacterium]
MKTKTIRYATVTLLLVALTTVISVTGANAQAVFAGNVSLPHAVRWGQTMLPAGNYSIRIASFNSPAATIHSTDGKIAAFVLMGTRQDGESGPSSLTIVTRGNERTVASLNLPQSGISLVYVPMTKAERETLAKTEQIETVPVVTAKK